MADKTVPNLTSSLSSPAVGDLTHVVDISDTTDSSAGTSKKATLQVLSDFFETLILTGAKIKTALGISVLSGSNTGDETTSTIKTKLGAATAASDGYATSTQITKLDGIATGATANSKATGAEVNTGTDDVKFVTPKSLADSVLKNYPQGFLINGKIVPSVTSNNLTVAIKGMDGNDPSATNPVYVRIGNTVRAITEATSVTANAGTNWGNAGSAELATREIDYFVYLIWEVGATTKMRIGFSRIPFAKVVGDFGAGVTNEKTITSNMIYANAADECELIGRFAATLSAGAGYTWSVPTFTNKNLVQRPIYETRWLSYGVVLAGSVTNPTTIDKTGTYRLGGNAMLQVEIITSSITNAGSGNYSWSLPFSQISNSGYAMGNGWAVRQGVGIYLLYINPTISATTVGLVYQVDNTTVSHNNPAAWQSGDYINMILQYKI